MCTQLSQYFLILAFLLIFHFTSLRLFDISSLYLVIITFCFFGAMFCSMSCDLSIYNIFTNSNANTPLMYLISATWSNHEGSLLLWCWLLSIFAFCFSLRYPALRFSCALRNVVGVVPRKEPLFEHFTNLRSAALFGKHIATGIGHHPTSSYKKRGALSEKKWAVLFVSERYKKQRGLCFQAYRRSSKLVLQPQANFTPPLGILVFILLIFCAFLLSTSNPFLKIPFVCVSSSAELNPVLQDPILAIHPPCIYAGYVASAVGFSLCLNKLMRSFVADDSPSPSASLRKRCATRDEGGAIKIFFNMFAKRIPRGVDASQFFVCMPRFCSMPVSLHYGQWSELWTLIRIWILICWCFLTAGILLGSWWAYHELGWGGWWFWDPVENASLMPWLCATACIHSVRIPRFNFWTLCLNLFVFVLSILGTFFVRSGLLASVHSFATDSTKGLFILCFLIILITISTFLLLNYAKRKSTGSA